VSRDGFRVADHDPRFLHDAKVRRLRREAPDDGEGAIRTLLYLALRDTSWHDGDRLQLEDADSPYEATPERTAALVSVGLIDGDRRIPAESWEGWFRPAWDRREKMRTAGREGNRKRWGRLSGPDSGPDSPPVSPSVPSDTDTAPSVSRPRATNGGKATNGRRAPAGVDSLVPFDPVAYDAQVAERLARKYGS
jgi:hypothetical protein